MLALSGVIGPAVALLCNWKKDRIIAWLQYCCYIKYCLPSHYQDRLGISRMHCSILWSGGRLQSLQTNTPLSGVQHRACGCWGPPSERSLAAGLELLSPSTVDLTYAACGELLGHWSLPRSRCIFLQIYMLPKCCLLQFCLSAVALCGAVNRRVSPQWCDTWFGKWEKGRQNNCCETERSCCKPQLEWGAQGADSSKRDESVWNDSPLQSSSYKNLNI